MNDRSEAGLIHHVEINVSSLETSLVLWEWFLGVLGYQPFQSWERGRSFRRGPAYVVLVQADAERVEAGYHRKQVGLNHVAFHASSRRQVDKVAEVLRERGIPVLYEDRHPHAGGKEHYALFFEDPDRIKIELVAPAEPEVTFREIEGAIDARTARDINELYCRVFDTDQALDLAGAGAERTDMHTVIAVSSDHVVGFKIGFRRKPGHFYSWMGGVDSSFRRRGIASELMRVQHTWCRAHHYRSIRTTTKNRFREMLMLDLRHGYDVIGSYVDEDGEPKLLLEIRLES